MEVLTKYDQHGNERWEGEGGITPLKNHPWSRSCGNLFSYIFDHWVKQAEIANPIFFNELRSKNLKNFYFDNLRSRLFIKVSQNLLVVELGFTFK